MAAHDMSTLANHVNIRNTFCRERAVLLGGLDQVKPDTSAHPFGHVDKLDLEVVPDGPFRIIRPVRQKAPDQEKPVRLERFKAFQKRAGPTRRNDLRNPGLRPETDPIPHGQEGACPLAHPSALIIG